MFDNEKEHLEKSIKILSFMKNYLVLPIIVLNIVLVLALIVAGNDKGAMQMMMPLMFGLLSLWLHGKAIENADSTLDNFAKYEKEQKIKDLNPHR